MIWLLKLLNSNLDSNSSNSSLSYEPNSDFLLSNKIGAFLIMVVNFKPS